MKFQVVDLDHNILAEFQDEYSLDRWLLEQISQNKITMGKFRTRTTTKGKAKEAIVENNSTTTTLSK